MCFPLAKKHKVLGKPSVERRKRRHRHLLLTRAPKNAPSVVEVGKYGRVRICASNERELVVGAGS